MVFRQDILVKFSLLTRLALFIDSILLTSLNSDHIHRMGRTRLSRAFMLLVKLPVYQCTVQTVSEPTPFSTLSSSVAHARITSRKLLNLASPTRLFARMLERTA